MISALGSLYIRSRFTSQFSLPVHVFGALPYHGSILKAWVYVAWARWVIAFAKLGFSGLGLSGYCIFDAWVFGSRFFGLFALGSMGLSHSVHWIFALGSIGFIALGFLGLSRSVQCIFAPGSMISALGSLYIRSRFTSQFWRPVPVYRALPYRLGLDFESLGSMSSRAWVSSIRALGFS